MRITTTTETELVVKDNLLWLSAICLIGGTVCVRATVLSGDKRSLFGVGLFLLFAVICLQKSTFVFDGVRRMVTWQVLRFFKTSSGSLSFDAIQDVAIEITSSGSRGTSYRLTIVTAQERIPLSAAYSGGGSKKYEAMREQLLLFVLGQPAGSAAAASVKASPSASADPIASLEPSIRALLQQGRKIEAITLLRSHATMGLTEAHQRVSEIEKAMAVGK